MTVRSDLTELPGFLLDQFGSAVTVESMEVLNERHDYLVLDVALQHPHIRVIVKLAGPESPMSAQFERTAAIHRLVEAQTQIPMPETIAADESYRRWPWRFFIRAYLEGEEWSTTVAKMSPKQAQDAFRQIGWAVGQLHQISFDGFGEIGAAGRVSEPGLLMGALRERARARITAEPLRELFFAALEQRAGLFDPSAPVLDHEDLHQHNILFRQTGSSWSLAAILDFDKAWAGSAESDLARMDLWNMTGDFFYDGYTSILPVPSGYAGRRALYQFFWCLEYAKPTADHLALTQGFCREFGLPVIRQFRPVVIEPGF